MTRVLVFVACLILGGMVWWFQSTGDSSSAVLPSARAQAGEALATAASDAAASSSRDGSRLPAAVEAGAVGRPSSASQGASAPTGRRIADLVMTRQLGGDHRIEMDGRPYRVLGSKEVTDPNGKTDTLLVVHDDLSGQVRYFLPGLQFTLAPGVDVEAYIRDHPRQRRLFVNPIYAQVAVDAAEVAAEYTALRQDARVVALRFMTPEPVRLGR